MDEETEKVATHELSSVGTNPDANPQQRIQFIPTERPERSGRDDTNTFVPPSRRTQSVGSVRRRPPSIVSIPPVISAKDRKIRENEKKEEVKHVDISEHLMVVEDVAERYKTMINKSKPAESLGLSTHQAADLLLTHGPNNLTPPSKRHWILKFWDCLSSLFNLLLIFAGFLEYILLGIDFKGNFQNVSFYLEVIRFRWHEAD